MPAVDPGEIRNLQGRTAAMAMAALPALQVVAVGGERLGAQKDEIG